MKNSRPIEAHLDSLPNGWRLAELREILHPESNRARDVPGAAQFPVLSLTKDRGLIAQSDRFDYRVARADVSDYKVVRSDWIVYNPYVIWEGAIHGLVKFEAGLVSPVYMVWRVVGADPRFVRTMLRSQTFLSEYSRLSSGVVRRRRSIRPDAFLGISIPLPPVDQQQAIGDVLSGFDLAIASTAHVCESVYALKDSLREHLLMAGAIGTSKSAPSLAPRRKVSLRELLREPLRNGHSARESLNGHGIRTLTLTAATRNDFSETNTKLTEADSSRVRDLWLEPGDVFVERANTRELVGLAALYEGPPGYAIFPDLLVRVRVDGAQATPRYVREALMSSPVRSYFQRSARGTAGNMPKIGHSVIESVELNVPPVEEQRLIGDVLEAVDEKARAEMSQREALVRLRDSIVASFLSGELFGAARRTGG